MDWRVATSRDMRLLPTIQRIYRLHAFIIAVGPDISHRTALDNASTLDLVSTIISYLGIEPPDSMHGRVPRELHGHGGRNIG